MKTRIMWANIVCHEDMKPYKLIVTDGEFQTEISVENTPLETVKKAARNTFNVLPHRMFITQVFDDDSPTKE